MKYLEKIPSCQNEYRAEILHEGVLTLHVSGVLTDAEADRVHLRIKKKVRAELAAMSSDERLKFCQDFASERKAKG